MQPSDSNQIPDQFRYEDMFNDLFKNPPIENKRDIDIFVAALMALSQHAPLPQELERRPALAEKVRSLQEIHDEPELYVPSEYAKRFQQLFDREVGKKAEKLGRLSSEEKGLYLQELKEANTLRLRSQERMQTQAPPQPGTEAHSVSGEEYFRELQRTYGSGSGLELEPGDLLAHRVQELMVAGGDAEVLSLIPRVTQGGLARLLEYSCIEGVVVSEEVKTALLTAYLACLPAKEDLENFMVRIASGHPQTFRDEMMNDLSTAYLQAAPSQGKLSDFIVKIARSAAEPLPEGILDKLLTAYLATSPGASELEGCIFRVAKHGTMPGEQIVMRVLFKAYLEAGPELRHLEQFIFRMSGDQDVILLESMKNTVFASYLAKNPAEDDLQDFLFRAARLSKEPKGIALAATLTEIYLDRKPSQDQLSAFLNRISYTTEVTFPEEVVKTLFSAYETPDHEGQQETRLSLFNRVHSKVRINQLKQSLKSLYPDI